MTLEGVAKRIPSVKWNLSQGPMLALRERSVAILATERATLIVVYKGVSFFTLVARAPNLSSMV